MPLTGAFSPCSLLSIWAYRNAKSSRFRDEIGSFFSVFSNSIIGKESKIRQKTIKSYGALNKPLRLKEP